MSNNLATKLFRHKTHPLGAILRFGPTMLPYPHCEPEIEVYVSDVQDLVAVYPSEPSEEENAEQSHERGGD